MQLRAAGYVGVIRIDVDDVQFVQIERLTLRGTAFGVVRRDGALNLDVSSQQIGVVFQVAASKL